MDFGFSLEPQTIRQIGELTETPSNTIEGFLDDLSRQAEFTSRIIDDVTKRGAYAMIPPSIDAAILYSIVRASRPNLIVETGVASGVSSSFILRALEDNGNGQLFSIDLPKPYLFPPGVDTVGWRVPPDLRSRWHLVLGKTSEQLPKLLASLVNIDIFFHDSDHSYGNMMFEFGTAWTFLRHEGLLLSDDADENESFSDFSKARDTKAVLFPSASANKKYGIAACKKIRESREAPIERDRV